MAKAARLTARSFDSSVLESDLPVLVDFWASWCPPCKAVEPLLDDLAEKYDGRAVIAKLQVDRNPSIASRFDIQGVPTFITFSSGAAVERAVGALPGERLASMIDRALNHGTQV